MATDIRKIGIVGTGTIGASWAAFYLSRGLDVAATDPADGAEGRLRAYVDTALAEISEHGLLQPGSESAQLTFDSDLGSGLAGVDFVQENGPERIDIKHSLLQSIETAVGPDVIIASSSSGLKVSDMQEAMSAPERMILGHPFNPPHVVPLVEVAGGTKTSEDVVARTLSFYQAQGKVPVHLRKEMKGHIANRIQAAVVREVFYLVQEGVASVEDIDKALSQGPGLRWAVLGQFVNSSLGGGPGGFKAMMSKFAPALEAWWADLGTITTASDELVTNISDQLDAIFAEHSSDKIAAARDQVVFSTIKAKLAEPDLPY
ncbi:3-hydroxyacyl-CoA dehydrogenase NAD-binding protein OS=Tsukamurella paurometabola (strain ATCC 8368/ DSM / CCUG 35730 / CIP 100753 / JCM 10117 / KCTC 9821/ NBRC 16120 / NCIMB 702349 / NCTC 13040) OX=521096 GN=Tpau_2225 PE=4 SV=1 [Tsukamurella paurometabola]|uniref:3-hydroxyacyl-CoA dehydrogenase NAD-binding protein n=1 Tax=Tsukamurella paurometabola (strain ATCC 8368 / DSM 20162 / CCUG 35730 / CIP 100753 / JCM 10117 / KCTC 9821 / NBRC 16120 / NCIMB 702349 / NCTC 13040) TaxID=521096 RepID=D5UQ64_TSUPD|nr:3-hydroxyacyl-CoA dehydrogenase NAD-binding domain-containing protein [Tsukamurella paurometabola]ADG78834.1 3-hydroxyacyl-CoA dehydrogenase NAD-binding protein [Tsukamurella paurometabola DSM 20162]SUP33278.1 Probable 3-hydroxybutyryl-CoA dehydrogenase [Tsukamurella paurometabola]